MNAPVSAASLSARVGAPGLDYAIGQAERLLVTAEAQATMLADLGDIELPTAARAQPVQMRAIASLYLASTLESAGLIGTAEDFTRLVRSGGLPGDLGTAAPLIEEFWNDRTQRTNTAERLALFARLFGAPAGPVDAVGGVNGQFEEMLLDLCDAIVSAPDAGAQGQAHVRAAGVQLAENVGASANDMVLMMARDIVESLRQAIAILNHQQVRALLGARTLWDSVAAIDWRFHRPTRPTLNHLRRGRAGMAVLAWLADALQNIDQGTSAIVRPGDSVVGAAVDWVDESLSIARSEQDGSRTQPAAPRALPNHSGPPSGGADWQYLAR
jgi:hypothetical protein